MKIDVEPATWEFACPACGTPILAKEPVVWTKTDAEQRVWPMCWNCWRKEWAQVHGE